MRELTNKMNNSSFLLLDNDLPSKLRLVISRFGMSTYVDVKIVTRSIYES